MMSVLAARCQTRSWLLDLLDQQLAIQNVILHRNGCSASTDVLDVFEATIRKVVVDGDPNTCIRKQVEYMAADEARAAGQENPFYVRRESELIASMSPFSSLKLGNHRTHCSGDRFAGIHLGLPANAMYLRRIQSINRNVGPPAACAAAVFVAERFSGPSRV